MNRKAVLVPMCGVLLGAIGCGGRTGAIVSTQPTWPREIAVPVDTPAPVDSPGPAQEPVSTPSPSPGIVHTVAAGQTLYSIARTYGLAVTDLVVANDLRDPDRLRVGQLVFVPGARAALPIPEPLGATGDSRPRNLLWPVAGGRILSRFGAPRGRRRHEGLDIHGRRGQPVVAVDSGRVVYSGAGMRGYGKTVIIDHGEGMQSLYAHNSKLVVRKGERVRRGQIVARIGRTGNASTAHCHLEIRQDDVPRDPLLFVAAKSGNSR